ncbi:alpha/beta fold hydrolase [Streptomyces sp. NPDC015032]|uniref:alpha/beta fold hydrolase n=1 Tax=Streptomyces sp. NPDC015032 TaxID=3364937 RepID=UPI0036FFCB48
MSQAPGNSDADDRTNAGLPRRHVLRTAGAGALGLGLGGIALTAVTLPQDGASQPHATGTPDGLGSVEQAPHLPAGFTRTFTSRFVRANGIRQHAVVGGEGPPLLLVHGWPETWYAWRLAMPELARHFTVVAVDQRGIGLTDKPESGYDTRTLAHDHYVRILASQHDALRGSFGWYRALDTTSAQDQQRSTRPLTLPVLAIGGAGSLGGNVADTMKRVAHDVRSAVIPGAGHWVAEEAPREVLAALTTFLAPYQDQDQDQGRSARHQPAATPGR